METIDLAKIFPNLDPEADPESYPVVSKDLSPFWYSLFPKIYPESPARVVQAYKSLFQTAGLTEHDTDSNFSEVSESGSSGTCFSDPPTSVTSGEFNPARGEFYSQAGLVWETRKPSKQHKGIANSCNIDGFLTNLMIQFNRQKYDFDGLLKFTEGKGKEVEDFIRDLTNTHKRHPGVKRPTVAKSIKQQWVDLTNIGKLIKNDKVIDLQGDEDHHIFDHLDEVTRFNTAVMCKCVGPASLEERHDIDIKNKTELNQALSRRIRNPDGEVREACQTCKQKPGVSTYVFPETTWILHFAINKGHGAKLNYADFPESVLMGPHEWFKSYASYWTPLGRGLNGPGHTVSLHFIKNKAYYYDDTQNEGQLYYFGTGPMNKRAWLQHVVYLKKPNIK